MNVCNKKSILKPKHTFGYIANKFRKNPRKYVLKYFLAFVAWKHNNYFKILVSER